MTYLYNNLKTAMKDDFIFWGVLSSIILIGIALLAGVYLLDKGSCYDKAYNYNGKVKSYSFWKNYCFCEMPDEAVVNLENYRDTNEISR